MEEPADDAFATLVQAGLDYSALADPLRGRIQETVEGFDLGLIDRVRALALELGGNGPAATGRAASPEVDLRNRMMVLIARRVNSVRSAARFVFSKHPEIARQAGSAHERQKRLAARRAKLKAAEVQPA